jgi:hypothetical protein
VQYQLDVQYAVGRLAFDTVDEYRRYAASVVAAETYGVRRDRRIAFFAPQNEGDRATSLSRSELVEPLVQRLAADHRDWEVHAAVAADATKKCLVELLGGTATPSVLFTAGHGLGWPSGDPAQPGGQGALVCQEWAGPATGEPVSAEQYVAADDVSDDAAVHGLIAFHFACFGAATPEFGTFAHRAPAARLGRLAPAPMISALPRRLLGHEGGGALAVAGHVDRAWSYSFTWPGAPQQTEVYRSCLERLICGHPIGSAFDYVNQRYAELSSDLSMTLEDVNKGLKPNHVELSTLWAANNDARGFIVLGDPAVRLPNAVSATVEPARTASAPRAPVEVLEVQRVEQADPEGPVGPAEARRRLVAAAEKLAENLEHAADGLAEFEVATCSADLPAGRYDPATARIRILSRSTLAGDVRTVLPERDDADDADVWSRHLEMLSQAQAARRELLRTLGSVLGELLEVLERA